MVPNRGNLMTHTFPAKALLYAYEKQLVLIVGTEHGYGFYWRNWKYFQNRYWF
jgi:hypothetical protein